MRVTAIVPVKRFGAAKQRLSGVLEPTQRGALAAAMLEDVLAAIGRCECVERTLVVSGEETIAAGVERAGAGLLPDPDDRGHSEAALIGVANALDAGAGAVALLPGDCPLLDPAEVDSAIGSMAAGSVGVIPDRHGSGTNGLLLAPPNAIVPAFGPGSRERHLELATAAGASGTVVPVPSLELDLDTGDDLAELQTLVERGLLAGSRTAEALARLAAPDESGGARLDA